MRISDWSSDVCSSDLNDRLAARVAAMLGCDTLVLLSDIDGLYTADPRQDPNAAFIPEVAELTPEIEAMAGRAPTGFSSCGMITKLVAGKIANGAGCSQAIATGGRLSPIQAVAKGGRTS